MGRKGNKFHIFDTDKVKIEIIYKKETFYAYCDLKDWNEKLKAYTWTLSKDNHGYAYYVRTKIELPKRKNGKRRSRQIYMHRLIMDTPKRMHVDHKDWDGRNNCRYNLENVTPKQNNQTRRANLSQIRPEEYPLGDFPPF